MNSNIKIKELWIVTPGICYKFNLHDSETSFFQQKFPFPLKVRWSEEELVEILGCIAL